MDICFFTPSVGVQKLHGIVDRHQHLLFIYPLILNDPSRKILGIALQRRHPVRLQKAHPPPLIQRLGHNAVTDDNRPAVRQHLKAAHQCRCNGRMIELRAVQRHIGIQLMQNRGENHSIHCARLYEVLQVQRIALQHFPEAPLPLLPLAQRLHHIAGNVDADRDDSRQSLLDQIQQHTAAGADVQHLPAGDILQNDRFIVCRLIHLA
ncbi:hypothetical protein D3C73_706790 [compost metagenome]